LITKFTVPNNNYSLFYFCSTFFNFNKLIYHNTIFSLNNIAIIFNINTITRRFNGNNIKINITNVSNPKMVFNDFYSLDVTSVSFFWSYFYYVFFFESKVDCFSISDKNLLSSGVGFVEPVENKSK
jgi:hypothetical protein